MRDDYLNILKEKKVNYFYHFTNFNNIESILKHGICNRDYMNNNGVKYYYTDEDRFDSELGCISLSLDSVNKSMLFYKRRKINTDWIIFELDAKRIINDYYDKIYYCKYNASSKAVISILNSYKDYLKSLNAFRNIFNEDGTLNSQAELLLEGNIDTNYINRIYVESLQIKLVISELLNEYNINNIEVVIKKEMF